MLAISENNDILAHMNKLGSSNSITLALDPLVFLRSPSSMFKRYLI